jgi:hypothetical protein
MQKLQRKMGGFLPRSADDAQVSVLLKEFEDGDQLLKIVCSLNTHPLSPV